ncbi:MAG: Vitamin B12 dependent methionine synthase activation subunit [Clostridia bacterium]|nr:Vitamin B12 dependent methionine synthase activation subunit [Clostridia bacterium]
MNTVFVKSYTEPRFDEKEILRYAMCKEPDEQVTALLNECLKEIQSKLVYKVCYIEASADSFFNNVDSKLLNDYFADCRSYILFAATIGIEIDRLITKYNRISPAKAQMIQAIGAERAEALCDLFCADMKTQYVNIKPRISPGYGDMPLEMQRKVFSLLDCPRKIGLTLNDSMLMSPSKSVTAFIGVLK